MAERSRGIAAAGEPTIVITRTVDAPRDLVWKVWTDAAHIARWWGPNGFTNTIHAMDVRPGGTWCYIMHGPDGTGLDVCREFRTWSAACRLRTPLALCSMTMSD